MRKAVLFTTLFTLLVSGTGTALAAPGELVRSFGDQGFVNQVNGPGSGQVARDVAVLEDGRVIVVGRTDPTGTGVVFRYLPSGVPDPDFGSDGVATVDGVALDTVKVDKQGRILVAGHSGNQGAIARLLPDGSMDSTFGENGVFRSLISHPSDGPSLAPFRPAFSSIELPEDGTILAAGGAKNCERYGCDLAILMRVDQNGDPTFMDGSAGGTWSFSVGSLEMVDLLPDGRLVIATTAYEDSFDGGVEYFNTIEVLDRPDPDGIVNSLWQRSTDQREGAPVTAGQVTPLDGGGFLMASGSFIFKAGPNGPDRSFGAFGRVEFDGSLFRSSIGEWEPFVTDVRVDSDENLIISGRALMKNQSATFIARLDSSGLPDPTFSNDGFRLFWPQPSKPSPNPDPSPITRIGLTSAGYLLSDTRIIRGDRRISLAMVQGGPGQMVECDGRPATWIGGPGNDRVDVQSGVVATGDGNDEIRVFGYSGEPLVCGGPGDDRIEITRGKAFGGPGNDQLFGNGERSKGRLIFQSDETLIGGPGNDRLQGFAGNDILRGSAGNDVLRGGSGEDDLYGEAGRDQLFGETGNDHLFGGPGRDKLDGGPTRKPDVVYSGVVGETELELIREGKRMTKVTMVFNEFCSMLNQSSDGDYRSRYKFPRPLSIRGAKKQIRFSSSYSDDWFSEEVRLKANLRGKTVEGRFMRTSPSPWWAACWTGKSQKDPWLDVRATLQPKRVQLVRQ